MKISSWKSNPEKLTLLEPRLKEIFFLSSLRKEFLTEDEKQRFYQKWTQYYFDFWPEDVYLVTNDEETTLLGYLMGCRNSHEAKESLITGIPSYEAFEDQFTNYNCHLHINCHPNSRGMGIGSMLLSQYFETLQKSGNSGVHIVTSAKSKNVDFYRRAGLDKTIEREWRGYKLFFMGKKF